MSVFKSLSFSPLKYTLYRPTYNADFYAHLMAYHTSNNAETELAVDVGCGPGAVATALLPFFDRVEGYDLSATMISTAENIAREDLPALDQDRISFFIALSDTLDRIESGTVDLLTVAQAIQWFNLNLFFTEAHRVLRPGGTLAYWFYIDGIFHPQYDELNRITQRYLYGDEYIGPHWEEPARTLLRAYLKDVVPPLEQFGRLRQVNFDGKDGFGPTPLVDGQPVLFMYRRLTLNDYISYIRVSSGYLAYKQACQGADCVDEMVQEINAAMNWSAADNDVVQLPICWSTGYAFAKKV